MTMDMRMGDDQKAHIERPGMTEADGSVRMLAAVDQIWETSASGERWLLLRLADCGNAHTSSAAFLSKPARLLGNGATLVMFRDAPKIPVDPSMT